MEGKSGVRQNYPISNEIYLILINVSHFPSEKYPISHLKNFPVLAKSPSSGKISHFDKISQFNENSLFKTKYPINFIYYDYNEYKFINDF